MTVRYTTLNSVYEVDAKARQFRRVSGINPPTSNFAEDGLWHDGEAVRHDGPYGLVLIFRFDDGGFTTSSLIHSEEFAE